jgi:hypothetical protein
MDWLNGLEPGDFIVALILIAVVVWLIPTRSRVYLRYGWGKVYVLRDVANPHLLKVGMTKRSTSMRMNEVSETMTGGMALETIYWVKVPYVQNVEELAHIDLKSFRHWSERGTEWFKADESRAIRAVDRAAKRVKLAAKQQRKWSPQADQAAMRWRMTKSGPVTGKLF